QILLGRAADLWIFPVGSLNISSLSLTSDLGNVLVVQRIERRFPKTKLLVRTKQSMFSEGARTFTLLVVPVPNMLQFTQRFWRLESMKISKFVWLVVVAFATVASIAPQQADAIIVDGRVGGQTELSGSGTITESNPININGINSN